MHNQNDSKEVKELALNYLKLSQSGNKLAEEQLIILIKEKYMRRRIGKYLHKNRQCEDDDLIQEFLIGVALSISKASLNIGDPIEFIIQQGVYRVKSYLRKSIIQSTAQICMDCGYETRLNKVDGKYECKRCHSHNITTHEICNHDDTLWANMESTEHDIDDMMTSMLMAQFEQTLQPGTNIYQLYILLKSGVNRDNPAINNYIKEISIIWGGCSEQNVLQNMQKLQLRLTKFLESNNIKIRDNKFID